MLSQKQYIKYLTLAISLFLLYHIVMWTFFTSKIFGLDNKHSIGDLARMSYQLDMLYKRELQYTLTQSFLYRDIYDNKPVDIITIGDSFSHGGGGGKNPYYQDYLATLYNQRVLNIDPQDAYDFFETIVGLYKSGFLEKTHPKFLILQSVERFFPRRFSQNLKISNYKALKAIISEKTLHLHHLDVSFISTANYKLPYYSFLYLFKENAKKDIHKVHLTQDFFTQNIDDKMLFLDEDTKNIPQFTQQNIQKMNSNFNIIAQLLKKLNITLIVFPTPDKYDLYSPYIKENKHPQNPFYQLIRPLQKEYIFIDSKKILAKKLKEGTFDLYYPDDTHWSYKASKTIISNSIFKDLFSKQ